MSGIAVWKDKMGSALNRIVYHVAIYSNSWFTLYREMSTFTDQHGIPVRLCKQWECMHGNAEMENCNFRDFVCVRI